MMFAVEDVEAAVVANDSLLGWITALAWPLAFAVVTLALFVPRTSVFRGLLRSSKLGGVKIAAFGAEIELTQEAKTTTERLLDSALTEFRQGTQALYRQYSHEASVEPLFVPLWKKVETFVGSQSDIDISKVELRGALYVEHALLRDYLIQLTDYLPTGGGSGRAFSMRFGIVGEAWRAEASRSHSLSDEKKAKEDALIQRFGFSSSEASANRKSRDHESFAGVLAKGNGDMPLAVLYLDAEGADVFSEQVIKEIEQFMNTECPYLLSAVGTIQERVKATVPRVRIPDDQHI